MRKTILLLALIVALLFCMPSILARGASLPTSVMTEKDAMPCESSATTRAVDIPHSITLDRSSTDLVMGGQLTLIATPSPSIASVTWTSSNSSVASVNQSGVVTGHQVGRATITATVSGISTSASATCTVYVHLADGVYIIENSASSLCLNSRTPSSQSTTAFLTQLDDSDVLQPKQGWKITYTTSGFYVIRPLEMLDSILTVDSSGNVVIIPYAEDATVQILNKWEIGYNNLGYYFYHKGLSTSTLKPVNASMNNTDVQLANHSYDAVMHWSFTPIEGVLLRYTDSGVAMSRDDTIWLDVRQSHSLSDQGLTIEYYGAHTNPTWRSSNDNAVTVNSSGTATVRTYGSSTITLEVNFGNKTYYKDYYISASAICAFYGIPDNTSTDEIHDHVGALSAVFDNWVNQGWKNITFRTNSVSTSTCVQDLKSVDIFIIRSHGHACQNADLTAASTGIILNNSTHIGFYSHYHPSIAPGSYVIQNTDTFFNLDLVIFIGCNTGYGGENGNNLPNMMESHGARVAIGFTSEIPCIKAEEWTTKFIAALRYGSSISEAILALSKDKALNTCLDGYGNSITLSVFSTDNVIVCGDENFVLFPNSDP